MATNDQAKFRGLKEFVILFCLAAACSGDSFCPTSHPFAFGGGDFCCLTRFDKYHRVIVYDRLLYGRVNDGCLNQDHVRCSNAPCKSNVFRKHCVQNDAGYRCKNPFEYNGKQYRRCTKAGGYSKHWCYDVRGNGKWDYCTDCPDVTECTSNTYDKFYAAAHNNYMGEVRKYVEKNRCCPYVVAGTFRSSALAIAGSRSNVGVVAYLESVKCDVGCSHCYPNTDSGNGVCKRSSSFPTKCVDLVGDYFCSNLPNTYEGPCLYSE